MDSAVPRVFGPVRSRRLGSSLGVNTIPGNVCSYSCLYCQAGVREADVDELRPGSGRERVDELVSEGSLERVVFDGQRFYRTARPRARRSS